MASQDQMAQDILNMLEQIRQAKSLAADTRARIAALSSQSQVGLQSNLQSNLSSILPQNLIPKNVGNINAVAWNFHEVVNFNLATTLGWPVLSQATQQTQSFQVSQEACFLMMSVSRWANDYTAGGDLGPLLVEFRDRQSSRFFNNAPIPIQNIGTRSYPTIMPTPMLIMPNAFLDITITNDIPVGVTQPAGAGSTGIHQFLLYGYRFRIENADKVLSAIFG